MIKILSDNFGGIDSYTTKRIYLDRLTLPEQNIEYLGNCTAIRYKDETSNYPPNVIYRDSTFEQVYKINDKFYYYGDQTHPIEDEEITEYRIDPNLNNTYEFSRKQHPLCTVENSGVSTVFKILRYDLNEPNKVIAVNEFNQILVMTNEQYESICDWIDCKFFNNTILGEAERLNMEYISPSSTLDEWDFFSKYNDTFIHKYPIQDESLLGMPVFTEYYNDLFSMKSTEVEDMQEDIMDEDNNILIETEDGLTVYSDKQSESYDGGEIHYTRPNQFIFTDRMQKQQLLNNSRLANLPKEIYMSFVHYYNIYSQSITDIPRRPVNLGIIVRADLDNDTHSQIVVMEFLDENNVRFVTNDECRIYYNTTYSDPHIDSIYSPESHYYKSGLVKLDIFNWLKDKSIAIS